MRHLKNYDLVHYLSVKMLFSLDKKLDGRARQSQVDREKQWICGSKTLREMGQRNLCHLTGKRLKEKNLNRK